MKNEREEELSLHFSREVSDEEEGIGYIWKLPLCNLKMGKSHIGSDKGLSRLGAEGCPK